MKDIMKAIAVAALLGSLLFGCATGPDYETDPGSTNKVMTIEFNQEQYIWQGFLFPTNRTSGVQ